MRSKKPLAFFGGVFALILTLVTSDSRNEVFRDCTRELYDRVVRFEYLYYEGYWMYPYNKLRNQGPSFHYTEKQLLSRLLQSQTRVVHIQFLVNKYFFHLLDIVLNLFH